VTDAALVLSKLSTLRDHADRVRRRRPAAPEMLRGDVDLQDALAMSLLVAIQEAADIAFHISTDEGWGIAGSYADAFHMLARHQVIDTTLADELARTVAVRHRLAHGYASMASWQGYGSRETDQAKRRQEADVSSRARRPG
jgi:uncharacterized protein YutE (UPF0331/DUF86 family)